MAQFPDLLSVSAEYLPAVDLAQAPTRAQVSGYHVEANAPIQLTERTFLIPGVAYHVDAVSFEDAPAEFAQLRRFQAVDASLLFVRLLPKDWALSIRLAPGLAGDVVRFERGLFRMSALAMATRTFSKKVVFGGGGLISYSFGTLLPLPAIYLEVKIRTWLEFEMFLPAFLALRSIPVPDRLEVSARVDVSGNSYGVRDERIRGAWPCQDEVVDGSGRAAEPNACMDNLAYSTAAAGLDVSVRLFSSVWLNAYTGALFYRRFEPKNVDGDTLPGGADSLPRTYVLRAGLTWRIPGI